MLASLAAPACSGTTISARKLRRAAAQASAAPWLPDEWVATPGQLSGSRPTAWVAPRILNEPVVCRCSHLKKSCAPVISSRCPDVITGVFSISGLMLAQASARSAEPRVDLIMVHPTYPTARRGGAHAVTSPLDSLTRISQRLSPAGLAGRQGEPRC